ncbi:TRAP transporter permease DctM/Q, partial [Cribrihabitans sp. XS_ASV171]
LQAHLFVFWFALLSTITPPVCGAVFIAAGMIGENWLRVALTAMALGFGLYIIPLAMIANPGLIALAETPGLALLNALQIGIGLTLMSSGLIGARGRARQVAMLGAGAAVIFAPLAF